MRVVGMMSGTSFDAVDAAAADIEIDGDTVVLQPLGMVSQPYPEALRQALVAALPPAATTMEQVCRLDTAIGQAFADLAGRAVTELCGGDADLVVSHGQTVYHWVQDEQVLGTLQLGEPAWIAELTGLPVVADLRARDVAAGGQGAPLVSLLDVLWLRNRGHVSAALNLGGIANVTIVDPANDPLAFDTGPANALTDAVVHRDTGGRLSYDAGGRLAAAGEVDLDLLRAFLDEPYYRRRPPKSTGKELFNLTHVDRVVGSRTLQTSDLLATLTALTAHSVAGALAGRRVEEVVVAGGGTRNPTLMAMLRERLPRISVLAADDLGLPADAKEAYAFALLGFCTVLGLPATVPTCTGARHASVLGSLTPGRQGLPAVPRPPVTLTSLEVRSPLSPPSWARPPRATPAGPHPAGSLLAGEQP